MSPLYSQTEAAVFFLKGKLKVLEALPKPLKDSYKQTNRTYEYNGIPISRISKRNEKSAVGKLEGFIENTYLSSGTWQEVRLLPESQTVRTIFSLIVLKRGVTGPTKSPHTPNLGRGRPDISGVKTHAGKAQTQSDVST